MTSPAKSKTGMWVAIGGAVLTLLLICCAGAVVVVLVAQRDGDIVDLPSSSPSATPSASAAGADLASCVLGSWSYEHPGLTGTLHGSPTLTWTHDKGESLLTFATGGKARIDDDLELSAKDGAGAEHRFKRSGTATFTYQITDNAAGNNITYGPVSSTGKSVYLVNGVQQGEPRDREMWLPTPERIDCVRSKAITISGVNEGVAYSQVFTYVRS